MPASHETPGRRVASAFSLAWRNRTALLVAQIVFVGLFAGLLSPAISVAVRLALRLSGQPALTDDAIAGFVLSPAGLVAGLAVAALYLAVQVVGLAMMMAILGQARAGRPGGAMLAIAGITRRFAALLVFAVGLVLRILALATPFLAAAAILALTLLGPYDINYYLATRPPAFLVAVGGAGLLIAAMLALLVPRLLSWTVALPLVLFGGTSARDSFSTSAARMRGRRWSVLACLVLWAGVAVGLTVAITALGGVLGGLAGRVAGDDLSRLAGLLQAVVAVLALLGLGAAALTGGALAALLMEEAGWPEPPDARRRVWLARSLAAAACASVLVGLAIGWLTAPEIRPPADIAVIAHRGGAAERPENTMAAFDHGFASGADWIEIDVQESAEGEVIVTHDSDFMKLAGDPVKVWDVTAADLERLDVGAWFGPDYAGARVPRLAEVLAATEGRGNVLIELKYYGHQVALEERVAAIVEAAGAEDRIALMSLSPEGVARMKAVRPDWPVGLLAATAVGDLWEAPADFLAVRAALASPGFVRRAEAAGKPVHVWTVNDPAGMVRMAGLGVAGLITDRPDLAREALADLDAMGPAGRAVVALADRLDLAPSATEMRDASP